LISLPPVFTNRCCKLISDQFSIFFGSTSRRHRFSKFVRPESMTAQARHLHRLLAFVDPSRGCPALVVDRPTGADSGS
jgi:hypothetical protein